MPLRLGTRASALARWQAEWVAARLREHAVDVELVPITTTGDRRQGPIGDIGGQGVFTKEIQRALLDGRIDLAVHSLKDLPTGETPGLVLAAVPERGPIGDVLLTRRAGASDSGSSADVPYVVSELADLPQRATVGTGSLRRRAQLLHVRPDLVMKDVRGNVETRLRKLLDGEFDVLVLAEAGLVRLNLLSTQKGVGSLFLPQGDSNAYGPLLPAVGQGALALETRQSDRTTRQTVDVLDHGPTHLAVLAERAMLASLQGGCLAPVAALTTIDCRRLTLVGRVTSRDGREQLEVAGVAVLEGAAHDAAVRLGQEVAATLRNKGADRLIAASRDAC